MPRILWLTVGVALAVPHIAYAQSWVTGYGQGIGVARATNGQDASLTVYCPEGTTDPTPAISYAPSGDAGWEGADTIAFEIDGRRHTLGGTWSGPMIIAKAAGAEQIQNFKAVLGALRSGDSLVARIAGQAWAEEFSLRGSSEAIDIVMSDCPL